MATNDTIKAPCPVCGCRTTKPKRWFRIVRNFVTYAVMFASLNGNGSGRT